MSLVISHHTALWMHCSPKFASSAAVANYIEGPINASVTGEKVNRWYRPALSELTGIPLADLGSVDYLLSRDVARHPSPLSRPHSWCGPLPDRTLLSLGNDIYLSAPKFTFLQLSGRYDLVELSCIAMAMAGWYLPSQGENGLSRHNPVVSIAQLKMPVCDIGKHWGIDKVERATRWALDNSSSPMETSLALLINTPRIRGGYGLVSPILNARIYLSAESRVIYPHRYCEADVSAPDSSLLFEYLGKAFHKEEHRDIRRELALQREGYQLQYVTIRQLLDPPQRNEIMRRYAHSAGDSLEPPTELIVRKRIALLRRLLPDRGLVLEDGGVIQSLPGWALPIAWS